MAGGDGGKVWFAVGVWRVPGSLCEAAGDGCGPSSKISSLQFEEVVTVLTTEELHSTCYFIFRVKLSSRGFPCTCLQSNKMSFFGNVSMSGPHWKEERIYS